MITLIAAVDLNGCIGKGNSIPWKIPAEMKHFQKTTTGETVIMGRNTFNSLGKIPLKNRFNIVVSSTLPIGPVPDNLWSVNSLENAFKILDKSDPREVFIIGGAMLYDYALKIDCVDRIILSKIPNVYDGDVYFPRIPNRDWKVDYQGFFAEFDVIELIREKK